MSREERIVWSPEFQIQDFGTRGLKRICECIEMYLFIWNCLQKMIMSYFYTQTSSVLQIYITLESHFTFKPVFLLVSGLMALDTTSYWNAQGLYFLGWHWNVITHLYYNEDYSLIYSTNMDSAFIFMPASLWALGLQWSTRQKRLLPSFVERRLSPNNTHIMPNNNNTHSNNKHHCGNKLGGVIQSGGCPGIFRLVRLRRHLDWDAKEKSQLYDN